MPVISIEKRMGSTGRSFTKMKDKIFLFTNSKKFLLAKGAVCCLLFCILMVLSAPIFLFRAFVILLAKCIRPDLGEMLNGVSSVLVNDYFSGKSPRSNIIVTIIIRGHATIEEVKDLVRKNWLEAKDKETRDLTFKKFQQYPVRWLGFTFFKNCFHTFQMENHVKAQGSLGFDHVSEDQLNNFVEKLLNSSFQPEASPWELHLVNNYRNTKIQSDSEEELSVLLFKVHHSLADGYSILSALVEGFCEHSLSDVKMPVPRFPKRTAWEKFLYLLTFPIKSFCELSHGLSNVFRPNPWKIPDQKKSWYQVCTKSDLIPVRHIKDIKNAFGVSFTTVLLAAISSGINRSLQDRRRKRKDLGLNEEVDDGSMFCFSALPVPGHSKRLTNHMTGAFFDLPTGTFPNSLKRLQVCEDLLETTKKSVTPYLARYYVASLGWQFYPIGRLLFQNKMVTTGLTNFPSVPIHIEKNGKPGIAVDFVSGGNDGDAGVGIMVLSYNQNIRIAVTAEQAVMSRKEVQKFVDYIMEEINLLHLKAGRTTS